MRKLTTILALGTMMAGAAIAVAADKAAPGAKPADKAAAPASLPGGMTEEQMHKMIEAGTPGEFHKKLAAFNGKWNYVNKMFMAPGETPSESTGTAEFKTMMDGRFQTQTVHGTMDMGAGPMPFEGFSLGGYDNTAKKYWNTWVDSMGTTYMTQTGTVDATGKVFTYEGSYECPVFGHCASKSVIKWVDANTFTFSMNMTSKSGPPCSMEMTYTRAK